MMKKIAVLILLNFLLLVCSNPAASHQPRIISEQKVEIKNPQISQAFYAVLQGTPDDYILKEEKEFPLYISILLPDLPEVRKDYLIEVYSFDNGNQLVPLFKLEGNHHTWEPFYEPFAGDTYLQGPESERVLPSGIYIIRVSNPDNQGKYVLSVGREESFSVPEAVDTIRNLPALKKYFGKSPFTAFFNLVGLFILMSLAVLAVVIFIAYRFIRYLLRQN